MESDKMSNMLPARSSPLLRDQLDAILGSKASYSKDKLGSLLFIIKSVSQGWAGCAPPITLSTNGPALLVPGMVIISLFQKVDYSHLATLIFFQKIL